MIKVIKQEDTFVLFYNKVYDSDTIEMSKYNLTYYEIGQYMGGN